MDGQPTLLVLAAGMGSRYGGLKQLDPMGPHGETLLDYSVHDAIRAGFARIVFVIRRDIEDAFRITIGRRYEDRIAIDYVFQELEDLPSGYRLPEGRKKPWGTAHAVRAARNAISGNFAVINADDFYGADAYRVIVDHFRDCRASGIDPLCLVGYPLHHTLSDHGTVNRGICQVREGLLQSVEEVVDIARDRQGVILGSDPRGTEVSLDPECLVSMNFWGFSSSVFEALEVQFRRFLKYDNHGITAEFYIPSFVDRLIAHENTGCRVLKTSSDWFGITYPGDKPFVQKEILRLIETGQYPSPILD